MRWIIPGVIGFAVGAAAAYLYTKNKYESYIHEEIEKAREYYDDQLKNNHEIVRKIVISSDEDKEVVDEVYEETAINPEDYIKYTQTLVGKNYDKMTYAVFGIDEDDEPYGETEIEIMEDGKEDKSFAELIDFEDYINDESGWPTQSLYFNPATNTLYDEDDVEMEGTLVEHVGGRAMKVLSEAKTVKVESIYIRHNQREHLYEILVMDVD